MRASCGLLPHLGEYSFLPTLSLVSCILEFHVLFAFPLFALCLFVLFESSSRFKFGGGY